MTSEIQSLMNERKEWKGLTADQLIDIENNLESEVTMTDDEIVSAIKGDSKEDDEVEDSREEEEPPVITSREARAACEIMKDYMLQNPKTFP